MKLNDPNWITTHYHLPCGGSGSMCSVLERTDPIHFLARWHKRWLNQAVCLSSVLTYISFKCVFVLELLYFLSLLCWTLYVLSLSCSGLIVSTSKWLVRKTPLRKPLVIQGDYLHKTELKFVLYLYYNLFPPYAGKR